VSITEEQLEALGDDELVLVISRFSWFHNNRLNCRHGGGPKEGCYDCGDSDHFVTHCPKKNKHSPKSTTQANARTSVSTPPSTSQREDLTRRRSRRSTSKRSRPKSVPSSPPSATSTTTSTTTALFSQATMSPRGSARTS
jgi:hypothetical protein